VIGRAARRRWSLGLATLLGRKRGFFIPYRLADSAVPTGVYGEMERLFAVREGEFAQVLDGLGQFARAFEAIDADADAGAARQADAMRPPRWNQGWFPRMDAAVAYALTRWLAPPRIVEVGAGHSTRFLARAATDGKLATRITTIDPEPRAALYGLDFEFVRAPVQRASRRFFEALAPGDVLFVDSSHVLMPGTDVDVVLNRIWPSLAPGVVVHFHDIFLPDPYPADGEWRGYNEQNAVGALIASGAEILWSSRYAATRMKDAVAGSILARLPLFPGAVETSLWLRKPEVIAPTSGERT
jgi:predicted O-methyltransferase YrrM